MPERLAALPAPPGDDLGRGRGLEAAGQLDDAAAAFGRAARGAEARGDFPTASEALRRLGLIEHRHGRTADGIARCRRALELAERAADDGLAVEAMNVLAGIDLDRGELEAAERTWRTAALRVGDSLDLRGRIEQNLGILANIRGDWDEATTRYRASLDAFLTGRNARGCAIAYHNLGMIHADHADWGLADWYYTLALGLARSIGDRYLQGLCLLNHAEVHVHHRRFGEAEADAEEALGVFQALGATMDVAAAHKQLGVVFRESGDVARAEQRLVQALGLAVATGARLVEAETCREMALLYRRQERNQETLRLLNRAHGLFQRLDARADLVDVDAHVRRLEDTYIAVVREWGQSIESADGYTFGHCNRVADYAVRVARVLGLPEAEITTIRVGAYLHDLGKIEVPETILNKQGPLTPEEFEVIRQHPMAGVRLLQDIEFPWDITPIIRWHHEKHDGTGYPDRLAGDAIPLHAQIICIADVYDALTTTRSYRGAMTAEAALGTMRDCARWWRPDVFAAFLRSLDPAAADPAGPAAGPPLRLVAA
jgi:putative nucleotidyltransferase with HDIG domain